MLSSAVWNLLQNAFKFTRPHSHVRLKAYGMGERVLIEVEDLCGSLPAGKAEAMFLWAVEAIGGKLRVRDMPGIGCVFTIDLPREESLPHKG